MTKAFPEIYELRELEGPIIINDSYLVYVRPKSFLITPIWYKFDRLGLKWFWTPYKSLDEWIPIHQLTVPYGSWKGEKPAKPNVEIISYLQKADNYELFKNTPYSLSRHVSSVNSTHFFDSASKFNRTNFLEPSNSFATTSTFAKPFSLSNKLPVYDLTRHKDTKKDSTSQPTIGFGSFELRNRVERKSRDPWTREEITIPSSSFIPFKTGKTNEASSLEGIFGNLKITNQNFLQSNTKNILLVGYTGNGKSTLANVLTDTNIFREGDYCVSETKDIKSVEFNHGWNKYRVIDTPGFGDTSLTELEILNKIAEAVHEAKDGITQIFFIIGGRFSKAEMVTYKAVYKLFSKAIFDESVAKYITIVRTNFKEFENGNECQKDIDLMLSSRGELSEIISEIVNKGGRDKIVHVNNDSTQLRTKSRKMLLSCLQKCQGVYKPESIEELNRKISGPLREKQELSEEIKSLRREIDDLSKKEWTNYSEIRQLQNQLQEKDRKINSLSQSIHSQTMQHMEERVEKRSEIREWLNFGFSAVSTVATMVSTGCKVM